MLKKINFCSLLLCSLKMITVEIRYCVNDDEDDAHCLAGARCHHVCYGLMVGGKLHAGGVEGEGGCI